MAVTLRGWTGGVKALAGDQRGFGLVESLAAVTVLGVAVVSLVVALSSGMVDVDEGAQEVNAQSLAESQLEYIKSYPYDPQATAYPLVEAPEGYTIDVGVTSIPDTDSDIQKITVTILRDDEELFRVDAYKVNR